MESPVHMCPPKNGVLMPCCGRTPFEVPASDRITHDKRYVTCGVKDTKPTQGKKITR